MDVGARLLKPLGDAVMGSDQVPQTLLLEPILRHIRSEDAPGPTGARHRPGGVGINVGPEEVLPDAPGKV